MSFYNIFYTKQNDQKKWVIVLSIFLPLIFSIWGIFLSRKANQLSVAASNNREQIDTLVAMIKELQKQNDLLAKSVVIQEKQLWYNEGEIKSSMRPRLFAEITSGEFSDESNVLVKIANGGGDIYDLTYSMPTGVTVDSVAFPYKGQIAAGAAIPEIRFSHLREVLIIIPFRFRDGLMNKYTQNFILRKSERGYDIQFDTLKEITEQNR